MNTTQQISVSTQNLLNDLNAMSFDEINIKLANLKYDDSTEVFSETSIDNPHVKPPYSIVNIATCQNSFISGYNLIDCDNISFTLSISKLKKLLKTNQNDFTNASLDNFGQIIIENEQDIPYVNQFSDDEIANINNLARILEIPILLNCFAYRENENGTVTVTIHEDFEDFTYYNKNNHFVLPSPFKYYSGKLITDMSNLFNGCHAKTLDLSNFNTSNITDMSHMFEGAGVVNLDVSSFDTSCVTDMSFMFSSCQAVDLDISKFNTQNVIDMSFMFYSCQAKALDLSNFDTSNTTDISKMFCGCQALTINTSSFDTKNIRDMSRMFKSCKVTSIDLSNFDTSNVENMSSMFSGCLATTINLNSFNTSKVTNMSGMFYSCQAKTLDISNFDTSNVTYTDGMFDNFNNTLIK